MTANEESGGLKGLALNFIFCPFCGVAILLTFIPLMFVLMFCAAYCDFLAMSTGQRLYKITIT